MRKAAFAGLLGVVAFGGTLLAVHGDDAPGPDAASPTWTVATVPAPETTTHSPQAPAWGPERTVVDRDLEVLDPGNPRERDWARRNLAVSSELRERVRSNRTPLGTINPDDGFSLEELAVAYEGALDPLVPPDQRRMAIALLEEAATQGSIAALSSLAEIHASGEHRAPIEAEAYFQLAEMRGDWSMGLRHATTDLLYTLDPAEQSLASLRAHEILSRINSTRFQRGQPPLGVDPRPGLDRALQTMREHAEGGSTR